MPSDVDAVFDIARMLRAFVRCEMYSIIDRLANATSKPNISTSIPAMALIMSDKYSQCQY